MPWHDSDYMRLIPSLTYQPSPPLGKLLEASASGSLCVDLGAGGRDLGPDVLAVDFVPLPGTDLCADVQRLPFRSGSVDLVIATGLIEHVVDDLALMREARRSLRPGGVLHMQVPFLQNEHSDPIDSRRFTLAGFERLFEQCGFEVESSGVHIGPTTTITTLMAHYIALLFEGRSLPAKCLSMGAFIACSALFWPLKFLDRWLVHKRGAHRLAFGVFVTGRVPAERAE